MLRVIKRKNFLNGVVYAMETEDGYPIEVTDTFLPYYTKYAVGRRNNRLNTYDMGSRKERWMVGVSVASGCICGCKFCATGQLSKYRVLDFTEIVEQVEFVLNQNGLMPFDAKEFKINYTRMGEPFLNVRAVRDAIRYIDSVYSRVHHYVSTIGIADSDFSWIQNNITLQISLHAMSDERRDWLIPYKKKMTIQELGKVRTGSALKTTLNLTLVEEIDFDIEVLKKHFDAEHFFIKLSPINSNVVSERNRLGTGIVDEVNLI